MSVELPKGMNSKLPIKIQKKQVDSILAYFRECGWLVTENKQGDLTSYFADAPGWGPLTPIVEVYGKEAWFYVRLGTK